VQAKGIHNIFNKIITKFPMFGESYTLSSRKPPGHQTDLTKIELPLDILSLKQ
jgi:hypothetical protein